MRSYSVLVRSITGALCLLLGVLTQGTLAADVAPVAQVGSVPVTIFELAREQQRLMPFNVSFHSGISPEVVAKMKSEALDLLIERAYKVNYAMAEKIEVDKKAVDEQFDGVKSKFKTEKEFKKATGDEGIKGFRASVEREVLAKQGEHFAVDAKIKVTDAEIKTYYEGNKQMFKRPRQYKASHILVKVHPSSSQEDKITLETKAKELAKRAKSGEDFYNLAYYNSDDRSKYVGGDLGYFHDGQTVPEFENQLKTMKVGEISEPIKTMYGWHIIKLVELNEPKQLDFDEVRDKIRQQLEKSQRTKLYDDWMSELKRKYAVKKF